MKITIALLIGLAIGASCRWFGVPSPAPPKLVGAALVVAMTIGYATVDSILSRRNAETSDDVTNTTPAATEPPR